MVTFPLSTSAVAPSYSAVDPVVGKVTAYQVAIERATDIAGSASIANRFGIAAPTLA